MYESKIGVFVGFSRIFLLGILIFKGLTARRLYKSFGVKGLIFTRGSFIRGGTNCKTDEQIFFCITKNKLFGRLF
jgi:hypothetical protein